MLDQNTDRMWFVIGAVIVGAAIIFIANGTLPDVFASITNSFEESSEQATNIIEDIPIGRGIEYTGEIGKDIRLLESWSPLETFNLITKDLGSIDVGQSFPESSLGIGSRVRASGDSDLKAYANLRLRADHVSGSIYVYEVEVKNLHSEPVRIYNHFGHSEIVAAGEYKNIRLIGHVDRSPSNYLQLRIHSKDSEGSVDVLVGQLRLGVIEK